MMPAETDIEVDDRLIQEAMVLGKHKTADQALLAALRWYVSQLSDRKEPDRGRKRQPSTRPVRKNKG